MNQYLKLLYKRRVEQEGGQAPLLLKDHPFPTTRRQLLSQGFLGLCGAMLLPSFGSKFGRAFADERFLDGDIPFLIFDLGGGASIPGNFLVGKKSDQQDIELLRSYSFLGWDPRASNAFDRAFGLPMYRGSGISSGIYETCSDEARKNLRFGSFCHFSRLDTNANQASPLHLLGALGVRGSLASYGLGMTPTDSGGMSSTVASDAKYRPVFIENVQSFGNSMKLSSLFPMIDSQKFKLVGKQSAALWTEQLTSYSTRSNQEQLAKSAAEINEFVDKIASERIQVDARFNETFQKIYNISPTTSPVDANAISATIAMNVLSGVTGPGVIYIPGCDYHDGTQTSGDQKDAEIGRQIGRAVEAAKTLGTPLCFMILTDGGILAQEGTRQWQSDSNDGMTIIGSYHPAAPATYKRLQVGAYTDSQGVDVGSFIGGDTDKTAYAVLANYLNLQGRLNEFDRIGGQVLRPEEVEKALIFNPF